MLNLWVVLGGRCSLDIVFRLHLCVDPEKAKSWSSTLWLCLLERRMDPGVASKMAGRLSFAVTTAADRCGRAYIRAFHAQANHPLPGCRMGGWPCMAVVWFLWYLQELPFGIRIAGVPRKHMILWTDASSPPPQVGAVLWTGEEILVAGGLVPGSIVQQLLLRGDNQIGVAECLAIIGAMYTFREQLRGSMVSAYVDNQGVLGSIVKGSSASPEVNLMAARFGLQAAIERVAIDVFRVESAANIGDGPSRGVYTALQPLGYRSCQLIWPEWLDDLWSL